ncbi:tRNA (adenosine(37)-N6)-threonylcarbamoyltransferase complex transferase subunit TsaD [Candidatus Saccharibacteria bacterium]|nr:MAG: tRNA (adenosine(37)-N6)-threonylcarbamoyltransferase complex transferase subunit TsaD [Candidatus Saccharibacteria bacterium]
MRILGIESSCDETAASVVQDGKKLLSNVVASSAQAHIQYGGVVPEIAARSHIESILPVIHQALDDARCSWQDIDAIAVTKGAGLGGSLLVGVLTARTLAIAHDKPLYGVNHVEGHIYVNFLTTAAPWLDGTYQLPSKQPTFPMLGLIVSGGHSQLVLWQDHMDYKLLGQTHDDAIGEAFDKVARIIGLPYPGGPSISKKALEGNSGAYKLPKAKLRGKYDFSYSGLKTAVLRTAQDIIGKDYSFPSLEIAPLLTDQQKADLAASFQRTAVETIVDKTVLAAEEFQPKSVVIGGGVAANGELRRQLSDRLPLPAEYTDIKLCTDNAAMIATLGSYHHLLGSSPDDPFTLDIAPNLSM